MPSPTLGGSAKPVAMTPTFPAELPITAHVDELTAAIAAHQVVIVAGETGSGKTTQLPKLCLAMGRERFAKFFGEAPVISVSGRTYPVDVLYRPPREDEAGLAELVANAGEEITELDPRSDILVFLPGEREIREALGELEQHALPHTLLLPLYGRLSAAEHQRVFVRVSQRRVVLATNVAETSLTNPNNNNKDDAGD